MIERHAYWLLDVRNWFSNIEQHASEGVNKILIGNKCDMEDKRVSSTGVVMVNADFFDRLYQKNRVRH